jgi:4-oxalocrotonate tautomerase family enzyme
MRTLNNYYASNTNYNKPWKSVEQKRELVKVLTRETARIMKTEEEKIRILTYEVSKENWGYIFY